MKTIVIWDEYDAEIKFFVLEGNYSHLDNVYINGLHSSERKQIELYNLVYDEDTDLPKIAMSKEFPIEHCAKRELLCVIVAGLVP